MKFKRRHGEFEQECVLSESYTATDALPPVLPACRQPLLPACVFVTRDTVRHRRRFSFEKSFGEPIFFVMRGVREPSFHCITKCNRTPIIMSIEILMCFVNTSVVGLQISRNTLYSTNTVKKYLTCVLDSVRVTLSLLWHH
jgi:hypothetical protein